MSRGNIQAQGLINAGQRVDLNVTTAMCPKGRIIVWGITTVGIGSDIKPEILTDSLGLKLEHCRGKKVEHKVFIYFIDVYIAI